MTRFLLIDDDTDDRLLLCDALQSLDASVNCEGESNGYLAIDRLRKETAALPDIILLDINLPGKNGWDCLAALKNDQKLKGIPVVMYSTSSINKDVEKAVQAGASFLFTKPNEFEDLKNCLSIILRHLEEGRLKYITKVGCPWFHIASN